MVDISHPDRVSILLATYNGARYLPEQLNSIATQRHRHWQIIAGDDGSTDETRQILRHFSRYYPLRLLHGPGQGYVRNFLHLLMSTPHENGAIAFCDQDDVWYPEKLEAALSRLSQVPQDQPALYCSRRIIWDPLRNYHQLTSPCLRPPSFANACTENIASGNTIVLNPAAAALARALALTAWDVFAHDWWLYLLITGVGGHVIHDDKPYLLYRQHSGNAIGAGEQLGRSLQNKIGVLRGVFKNRLKGNITAIKGAAQMLTPRNRRCLALFERALDAPLYEKLTLLHRSGIYRQKRVSGFTFWGAACLGKV